MRPLNPPGPALQLVDNVPRQTNGIAARSLDDRNRPFTLRELEVILPVILPVRLAPQLFVGESSRATTLGMAAADRLLHDDLLLGEREQTHRVHVVVGMFV